MKRFSSWLQSISPDFWRDKFEPQDLIRVMAHVQSVQSMRLDVRLMEKYDIEYIPEHSVGTTYVWQRIDFKEPTYLGEEELYPWEYDIDPRWLFVDAIYDAYVDPKYNLQHDIDFQLSKGKIRFVDKLPEIPLYISKGRYAEFRIYNEIGNLLDYKRLDSATYRDSIDPILAAFYLGPTYNNLLAVLNLVAGLPVAKYGNETVISTANGVVETDKYSYPMQGASISVKEGDVLYKYQPLSDSVELITHKTHPNWWQSRPIDLFSKYLVDAPMSAEIRDYLMYTFLKDAVAYVKFNMNSSQLQVLKDNADILDLFYAALPTRTDVFMGQQAGVSSIDVDGKISVPDYSQLGLGTGVSSIYGLKNIPSDMFIYAPSIGRPIFTDTEDKLALSMNDYHWHIFSKHETNNLREFWKSKPDQPSYVEPNYSKVYYRLVTDAPWEHIETHTKSYNIPDTFTDRGVRIAFKGEGVGGVYSPMTVDMQDKNVKHTTIQGETICGSLEMDTWELTNLVVAKDGLEVSDGDAGYAITTAFPVGGIPKNVFIRTDTDLPSGTLVDVQYSFDKLDWKPVPDTIENVSGDIYFKVRLYASTLATPVFRRLYVNIKMINKE